MSTFSSIIVVHYSTRIIATRDLLGCHRTYQLRTLSRNIVNNKIDDSGDYQAE